MKPQYILGEITVFLKRRDTRSPSAELLLGEERNLRIGALYLLCHRVFTLKCERQRHNN
jgi:hypothetical protein